MSNIFKFTHPVILHSSIEGVKISKISSSLSVSEFIKLVLVADNHVNPRNATVNKITKSIHETLSTSSDLFWFKSKGILLATESCDLLERNRVRLTFDNNEYEGIMDGGHNTFAIASYLAEELLDVKLRNWQECKEFWKENYDTIRTKFEQRSEEFNFSIPVEILFPSEDDGSIEEYYDHIAEICSARNNNVQLKETAKGNKVGLYEPLKDVLDERFDVIWKTGGPGKIKADDVISLATIPLSYLKSNKMIPEDVNALPKTSIYSGKGKCIEFYGRVLEHTEVSDYKDGKFILNDLAIKSALSLTPDVLFFFDRLCVEFPNLYHKTAPGKFGRISAVDPNKKMSVPFGTLTKSAKYKYPFAFFYPLVWGLTSLLDHDPRTGEVFWKTNPRNLDLNLLNLSQYVELIKMIGFEPQKIGKNSAFYNEAEAIFNKL